MDNKTTRPSGRSNAKSSKTANNMKVIENSEGVQKRIEEAGYNFRIQAMQTEFSYEKMQDGNNGSNSSANADSTKKAGNYTQVGATAILAFKPLIPEIVNGREVKLKGEEKDILKEETDKSLDD